MRVYGSFQDIDERKSAEVRLKNISNNIPGVLFQYQIDTAGNDKLFYVSDGSEDLWGISPEEAMSNNDLIWRRFHSEDFDVVKEDIGRSAEMLSKWHSQWRYYHPDGSVRWHEGFGTPQRYADGSIFWDSIIMDITEQKKLEELVDQTTRLSKVGSWELDLINNEVYWSDITREIHEEEPDFEPDLDAGLNYYKEGEPRERIQQAVEETMKHGTPWDLELPIITAKGNEKWIRTIGEVEFVDGKPVRIYGSFQDIHDRKVAEVELQEKTWQLDAIARFNSLLLKEEDWLQALNKSLELFGEVAVADRVYFFEHSILDETGQDAISMKAEWVSEGTTREIDNPKNQNHPFEDIRSFMDQVIHKGGFNKVVSEIEDKGVAEFVSGQQIKSILALPVFTDKQFRGFIGFDDCTNERVWTKDEITFLKTIAINLGSAIENEDAEEALQQSFEEKNTILESIGDAFFAVDHEWTVTYWNHKAEEVLLMPREKIVGENLWELYEDATSLEFYTQYHKAVSEKVDVHFEEYYPTLEKWFEVSAYPSRLGLSVFFKDVTERKLASERMKELNRALEHQTQELAASNAELEQFAFVASHDLQEPLRMITSFLAQLERKYGDELDDKAQKYIHFATDGAKRMRQIILDLLDYSRVGRIDTEKTVVNIDEVLNDVLILNRKLIEEKEASVTWDEMPEIYAARAPIQQLFQNLVNNSLNYQKPGNKPVVKISAEDEGSYWKFSVQDNGIGINPEYTDKIFNIFQRLHGKEEYSGTGVGLAICKKIVGDHGGKIGVDSDEGEGSVLLFYNSKKTR
ncbi:PAS domain S-box protein [Rhodohalobacter sp.]|uniref:PAS domain S-box protein n=1 Tax=Rhodohalobacter sp. TaxID=1974210 RepID=UPI002ACECDBC|nr:PAS domain S-box protein [Rhodohalobacter sp.]MDZ7755435.1 PAS domain S-box protein [Rhodohalobacter sp.]